MASPSAASLRPGRSQPANLINRLGGIFHAGVILGMLYVGGLPHAIYVQLTHPNPLQWLNPVRWRDLIVEAGLPKLLKQGDIDAGHLKREAITEHAKGRVLELGAGTGLTLKYYNKDVVREVYLVEPFEELHAELRANVKKMGPDSSSRFHIIPYGVEEREKLKVYGIEAGTFDTVVLIQVLCSIPNREDHLPYLQSLLKPGGQLLLMEHVASDDGLTQLIQNFYNPVWTRLSKGCNVNRHSGDMVKNLGGWKDFQLRVPVGQHSGSLYPRVVGRYVKA